MIRQGHVIVALLLALSACTPAPFTTWQRLDGMPLEPARERADIAICNATAQNAGTAIPQAPPPGPPVVDNTTNVYVSQNPYVVVPPPSPGSYQAPLVDFSGFAAAGTNLQRGRLVHSTFMGCMAERGYVAAN